MDVSIIIVNFNTLSMTRDCLGSIFKQTKDITFEVIVSDNGSTDGSIDMIKNEFPQVILIENNVNLGFGAANNRGLDKASGKYTFYLNSDTILLNNAVKEFFDYWETSPDKDNIGILGSILLDTDQNPIVSGGTFPSIKSIKSMFIKMVLSDSFFEKPLKRLHKSGAPSYSPGKYDGYIMGADMFLLNNDKARFDESYFMYFEETDLQYNNFYTQNKDIILLDTPRIIHLMGGSSLSHKKISVFTKRSNSYNWQSAVKYMRKNLHASDSQINSLKKKICFIYRLHGKKCRDYIKPLQQA